MYSKETFKTRSPEIIGRERFKEYAVLVPIVYGPGGPFLLFEKRSDTLKQQPNEICFPGGKLEPFESLKNCAIRETSEELLISPDQIELLGPGDLYVSPFNLVIQPFIGCIKNYKDTFSRDEVEQILRVPVNFFCTTEPEIYQNLLMHKPTADFPYERIPGGQNYPWRNGNYDILFYLYDDLIIWGMTAQIAHSAVNLIYKYGLLNDQ